MSLLEHPAAQALRADAEVSADVRGLSPTPGVVSSALPRHGLYRERTAELAPVVLQGKLSKLQWKASEPTAYLAGRPRKPVQHFIGANGWDDEAVMAELRQHGGEALADPGGVLVVCPSSFPKKGDASCGAARQWCGRLGKVENCQVGVFLAYVTAQGYALLDTAVASARAVGRGRPTPSRRPLSPWPWRSRSVGASAWSCWTGRGRRAVRMGGGRRRVRTGLRFAERPWQRGLRYGVLDAPSNTSIRDLSETPRPLDEAAAAVAAGGPGGPTHNPPRVASPGGRRRGQGSEVGAGVGDVEQCRPRPRTAMSGRWSGW